MYHQTRHLFNNILGSKAKRNLEEDELMADNEGAEVCLYFRFDFHVFVLK